MEVVEKRRSILHALNVFLVNPIPIYFKRESTRYYIGYEPKKHRVHYLVYKVSKNLINTPQFDIVNEIKLDTNVDLNVREDYRLSIENWGSKPKTNRDFRMKNVTVRVVLTRYSNYEPIYGLIFQFKTRKVNAGGRDELKFSIPECPLISSHDSIPNVCYKLISKQRSNTGNHGIDTYIILAKARGSYQIGEWKRLSNFNRIGHRRMHIYPVSVTL